MGKVVADVVYDRTKPVPKIELVYNNKLVNVPGFSNVGLRVSFPPGGASPPHRHGGASVSATIIRGRSYNKMNDGPTRLMEVGESWYEAPGCHHRTSQNVSETEELELLASFVVETKVVEEGGLEALVVVDEEYRDVSNKAHA